MYIVVSAAVVAGRLEADEAGVDTAGRLVADEADAVAVAGRLV